MDEDTDEPRPCRIPKFVSGFLVLFSILTTTSVGILQQVWMDYFDDGPDIYQPNYTNCNTTVEYGQVDPFFTLLVSDCFVLVFLGTLLVIFKCPCFNLITNHETRYEKSQFALIGSSNTVAALCFIYAQSGCRTPPYFQAIVWNSAIPIVFMLRLIALRKRPTCRKLLCALLVLFAQFTLLIPDIFPSLNDESIYKYSYEIYGHPNALWVLCFFFGIIPTALSSIFSEKAVKVVFPHRNRPNYMNMIYFLFWCYWFSLLSLLFLFWTDCIPGFGMYDNIPQFGKGLWFNVKCFFGYEGCIGGVHVISSICIFLAFINRLINVYILRFMEGANFLVLISSVPTPLLYIFLTLFDEKTLTWHPHAYISTWLSVAALCIMIPALYIYSTGAPEKVPKNKPMIYCIDNGVQTVGYLSRSSNGGRRSDSYVQYHDPDSGDETCRLLVDCEPPPYRVHYNAFQEREVTSHSVAVGSQTIVEGDRSAAGWAGGDNQATVDYPGYVDTCTGPDVNVDWLLDEDSKAVERNVTTGDDATGGNNVTLELRQDDMVDTEEEYLTDDIDEPPADGSTTDNNTEGFDDANDDDNDDDEINVVNDVDYDDDHNAIYMNNLTADTDDSDTNHLLANIPVIVCSPSSNHGFVHD